MSLLQNSLQKKNSQFPAKLHPSDWSQLGPGSPLGGEKCCASRVAAPGGRKRSMTVMARDIIWQSCEHGRFVEWEHMRLTAIAWDHRGLCVRLWKSNMNYSCMRSWMIKGCRCPICQQKWPRKWLVFFILEMHCVWTPFGDGGPSALWKSQHLQKACGHFGGKGLKYMHLSMLWKSKELGSYLR